MLKMITAEIIFMDPNHRDSAIPKLTELGFDIERLYDWIDTASDACWINATILSELDPASFFDWMETIVEPLGGDVVKAAGWQLAYKPTP